MMKAMIELFTKKQ
jgi:hypothetical protein